MVKYFKVSVAFHIFRLSLCVLHKVQPKEPVAYVCSIAHHCRYPTVVYICHRSSLMDHEIHQ